MSIREVIARLSEAKNQLVHVKALGDRSASAVSEAARSVNSALDDIQDKDLTNALAKKAKEIADQFNGVMNLTTQIDTAIQRAQGIGRRR
jgi:hypothetical protein